MKHDKKYKSFGWLSALTLMLTTACASVDDLDLAQAQQKGKQPVTFIIQQDSQSGGTRADEEKPAPTGTIGRASEIDVLIYAVYELQDDGTYKITENTDLIKGSSVSGLTVSEGQSAIAYNDHDNPTKITLALDGDINYKVVFWAQNSKSDAFDTKDLKKVEVKYKNADGTNMLNNDESRDAFCAFFGPISGDGQTHTITLRRPLAQVNVGTAGWDYEGAAILRPSAVGYTQSMITLKGVARYYNALDNRTLTKDDLATAEGIAESGDSDNEDPSLTNVTFEYETIPAFRNITTADWADKSDEKYKPFSNGKEEFLIVDLDGKDGITGYKGYDTYKGLKEKDGSNFSVDSYLSTDLYTETFKYLSMCYVLVPEAGDNPAVGNTPSTSSTVTTGAVLPEVSFTTWGEILEEDNTDAEVDDDDDSADTDELMGIDDEDGDEKNEDEGETSPNWVAKTFTIKNVPVQKNWRTNILGNGFFIGNIKCWIYVVPDYRGEYNYFDSIWQNGEVKEGKTKEDEWTWEGEGNKGEGNPTEKPNFPTDDNYYSNGGDESGQGNDGTTDDDNA